MVGPEPDWLRLNRANWDERVAIHRAVPYGNGDWADGTARLNPIEEAELGDVAGLRVLHLQCHFGRDSLILAKRGAVVTGVDFSGPAIAAAQADAAALGLTARFIEANVYDVPAVLPETFDLVFTTWGTICWLPDLEGWARVVAGALRPGGRLYFADMHPVAAVLDDLSKGADGVPGFHLPYFQGRFEWDETTDYADPDARLVNSRTIQTLHRLDAIVAALLGAGMRLDWLHEHARLTWKQFGCLVRDAEGCWTWPDRAWVPLALSIGATKVG